MVLTQSSPGGRNVSELSITLGWLRQCFFCLFVCFCFLAYVLQGSMLSQYPMWVTAWASRAMLSYMPSASGFLGLGEKENHLHKSRKFVILLYVSAFFHHCSVWEKMMTVGHLKKIVSTYKQTFLGLLDDIYCLP